MKSFEDWKRDRLLAFLALVTDISRYARSDVELEVKMDNGMVAFSHASLHQEEPGCCVSPQEWREGFLANLPVFEFPAQQVVPMYGFVASEVRLSSREEEHFRLLLGARERREYVIEKVMLKNAKQGRAYLSSKFLFGARTLPSELFRVAYEPVPSEAPQDEDSGSVYSAPRPFLQIKPRYARSSGASWIEEHDDATGIDFLLGPGTASFSARDRFLLPLNLLMLKFLGAVVEGSSHLLVKRAPPMSPTSPVSPVSPQSPPSSGNKREKKLARVKREEEDDDKGEDVSTIGIRMSGLQLEK